MPLMIFVGIATICVALGRFLIEPRLGVPTAEGAYEAAAHLLVGFLVLVAVYDWRERAGPARLYLLIGVGLSVLELAMFLAQKMGA